MHDVRYDAIHDEILVANPFAQAILVFRGGANGEESPIRVIQGPHTQITGADRLDVDPVHNEIFVPERDRVLVFPRTGTGDVAPIRVLQGPETRLKKTNSVVVDSVHDVLIASDGAMSGGTTTREALRSLTGVALVIFHRTDSGNVRPQAVIEGPHTGLFVAGQVQVYPPKGWIIVANNGRSLEENGGGFVGAWSINDNGDVPPHWQISGPKSLLVRPYGVTIDPGHKEVIVADTVVNGILTYYLPGVF